jgi:subtilisin family serine protease
VDIFGSADPAVGGHGEFISHLVERLTGATPEQRGVEFTGWPPSDTWSVVAAMRSGVMTERVGVVNLSIGTYPCQIGEEIFAPPGLLLAELTRLSEEFGVTFVAAAGNDEHEPTDPLFYPAGYAETQNFVTSVGALGWSEAGRWYAADFTNIFDFNVWAPGVAVVSEIDGSAYAWSGTSFAAPHVAACVAARQC